MVGCDHAEVASGNPKAHFNDSFGTCSAVRPACCADWNLVLAADGDQPRQAGEEAESTSGGEAVQRPIFAPVMSLPSARPLRYSATARRSAPLRRPPCGRMPPAVNAARIASGDRRLRRSGLGARDPVAPSWQLEQSRAKIAEPSGA